MDIAAHRMAAIARVRDGKALASEASRCAAFEGDTSHFPEPVRDLLDKVVRHAHRVVDEDVVAAKQQLSEDEIFELVVCTAMGAASRQYERALAVIDEVG